ncbi:nucleoside hydrolase [Paenibacillus protaetiae]|uniref:Nucleoside hydrolase n=1 Tax=Paenibacillus protaetiae TaxID=2509456 RepID=A0A4P6EU45_9BACL|nr:nucleoside hydrolase [Paenibacillus protaetiae]QAY65995.1 nucleoside hydrolase [Paenibacillus protaetiae]
MTATHRMIIDADTGIDDALAILYAIYAKEIQLEGITTTFGNTDVEQATDNTLRLIKLCNPGYEIPVAKGAAGPLKRDYEGPVVAVHGHNGIGDAIIPKSEQQPLAMSAAEFLVSKANENPGEITLVMVGRMTNLALALQLDPSIAGKFKKVVIMGGTVLAPGNVTPVSEANLWGDPEAAAVVFESDVPLTVVGLDVTMKTRLTYEHLHLLDRQAPAEHKQLVQFLHDSLRVYFNFYRESNYFAESCPLHDPLAVLVAINPSLVQIQTFKATIDCGNGATAGMIVTDRRARASLGRDVQFCMEVDADRAVGQMLSAWL